MPLINRFSHGGNGVPDIPPGPITGLTIEKGNGELKLKWTDPEDANWAGTKVIRKEGSYPEGPQDGTVVIDSKVRNAYKTATLVDSGLTNETTYYYHVFPYSAGGSCNTDATGRISGKPVGYKTYGVRIDTTNSNPLTAVTYTDDAVGMTAGSANWDSMPIFKDIKPCLLKNGVVQYYLNPANFAQREDGTAATITDSSAGDVMIEFPKTGYKITTAAGNYVDIKITNSPYRGNEGFRYYAHTRNVEGDREKLYVGAYDGYLDGTVLCSLSGKMPSCNQTIEEFISYANNRGGGYDILGFYPFTLIQCLYLIKYKCLDSQTALGKGYTKATELACISTGGTDEKGMCWGESTGKQQMKLFGLEDFWGNASNFIGGLYYDVKYNILTAFKSFNATGAGYTSHGNYGISTSTNGYISKIIGETEAGFLPKEVNGSATTYWSDKSAAYGDQIVRTSAYSASGEMGGIFGLMSEGRTSRYGVYCARLMYL